MENKELMQQLMEELVIGLLKVTNEGKIELDLFIEENGLGFEEVATIQEHFTVISEILINYFNKFNE